MTIARLSKTFTDSLEFIGDKLASQNLSDISLNDIREGGKELYEICSPIFDTEMKDDLGTIFINIDSSFIRSEENDLYGGSDMLPAVDDEEYAIVVRFFNEIGDAIVKDCPDERMFINAYTKLINDFIFLEEREGIDSKEK